MSGHAAVEEVWRAEAPHVLAALVRRSGDLEGSEDAAQEALLAALTQWPAEGLPRDPRAWLVRVASRRQVDAWRSSSARAARERREADGIPSDRRVAPSPEEEVLARAGADGTGLPALAGGDDTLGLMLLCAHPSLPAPSQVALTLRAVAGLTTGQVASGFLVPEATMAQRISRAKARLRAEGARFGDVAEADLPGRVAAVLRVLYLVFNEGYATSGGPQLVDVALSTEAVRLARHVADQVPDHLEAQGLLALMLLTDARRAARTDADGELVPLADQDRSRWDRDQVAEGVKILERVLPQGRPGPYQLQAAIAAVHAEAPAAAETDWLQICALYRMLRRLDPSPAVTLNLAVAVGMAHGPQAGLRVLDEVLALPAMVRHHRTHAVRAHLLETSGREGEALEAYRTAAGLTRSLPEQRYLHRRAAALDGWR
ncbi:RNA polymerase sigma factor [Ornithinimicrobium tianjinense]|uniref:RNA polymerase sigma24 factor n=1 Tax=Ornithinimicrobium tianjinense TaxID=1195761 RepID=A0A917F8F2_9MICO|nr:DUF6596 domain-containing protein [Ornithinimicrobium tianjinense]GGF55340.1 RNA polymerase sigma24 factor [Ornithinimicrobium tianjinense]